MIDVKSEFQNLIDEIDNNSAGDIYKLKIIKAYEPIIIIGVDTTNENRQLYIDLGEEGWEDEKIKALPKWRGLTHSVKYIEVLGPLRKRYYLILNQEAETSADIYENICQNLISHIELMDEDNLFSVVYEVFDRWRHFFSRNRYKQLTDEQQQGLFGELKFIKNWLEEFPNEPPLIIDYWEGQDRGRFDFKNTKFGVEIKTSIEKLRKEVKISNEKQLVRSKGISALYLYVYFLESSKSYGQTLQMLVDEIRDTLKKKSERLHLKFNDQLVFAGFKDDEYTDQYFYVLNEEVYEVKAGFPRISDELLPSGVSHVSYLIDLKQCSEYITDKDSLFKRKG